MINKIKNKFPKINQTHVKKSARTFYKSSFLREQRFIYILVIVGVLLLINFFFVLMNIKTGHSDQPLRYSYLFGITKTGPWIALFGPLLAEFVAIVINIFFANYFYNKDKFLSYIFILINVFLAILVFVQSVALIAQGI